MYLLIINIIFDNSKWIVEIKWTRSRTLEILSVW